MARSTIRILLAVITSLLIIAAINKVLPFFAHKLTVVRLRGTSDPRPARALFFNRIPKTGSEMLVLLISWLQGKNNFTHVRLKNTLERHLDVREQLWLVDEVASHIRRLQPARISFDRHVHFTNFSVLGSQAPRHVNMLREPIDKLTSRFYYARATPRPGGYTPQGPTRIPRQDVPPYTSLEECISAGHPLCTYIQGHQYDLSIPYFCGHDAFCRELGNQEALMVAKSNVVRHFAVVGILEELNATFSVLEALLPHFFAGITELYFNELDTPHLNKNYQRPPDLSSEAETALRRNLSLEIDFYEFCKARLLSQFEGL